MPYQVRDLQTVTFSSGATQSPIWFPLDDATSLGIFLTTAVAATGTLFTVLVEPTDTGTNFLALQPGNVGTTALTFLASQYASIGNVAFRQMRLLATGAVNNGLQADAVKQISV